MLDNEPDTNEPTQGSDSPAEQAAPAKAPDDPRQGSGSLRTGPT